MTPNIKAILQDAIDTGAPFLTCHVGRDDLASAIAYIEQLEKKVEQTMDQTIIILATSIRLRNLMREQENKLQNLRNRLLVNNQS